MDRKESKDDIRQATVIKKKLLQSGVSVEKKLTFEKL